MELGKVQLGWFEKGERSESKPAGLEAGVKEVGL